MLSEGVPTDHTWCAQHTCFERCLRQGLRMQPRSDPLLTLVPLGHPPTLKSACKCFGLLTDPRLRTSMCGHTGTNEVWGSKSQSMHTKDPASVQITYAVVTRPSENPPRGASRGWRTTIGASCVSAKSISCCFAEIPKMLRMQGIFSSHNFRLGLLTLPCGMVRYWEAFGARTSCLLLGE